MPILEGVPIRCRITADLTATPVAGDIAACGVPQAGRGRRGGSIVVNRKRVRRLMRLMLRCRPENVSTKPASPQTVRGDIVCTSHVFAGLPFCKLGPAIT